MSLKATINLEQRKIGTFGLLWNKLTPTRGAKSVSDTLSYLSSQGNVHVQVTRDSLLVNNIPLPSSQAYGRSLNNSGVKDIAIPPKTDGKGVKALLDDLSDKRIKYLITSFNRGGGAPRN